MTAHDIARDLQAQIEELIEAAEAKGYREGRAEGYDDGYSKGYDDGVSEA